MRRTVTSSLSFSVNVMNYTNKEITLHFKKLKFKSLILANKKCIYFKTGNNFLRLRALNNDTVYEIE